MPKHRLASRAEQAGRPATRRCAVYTRKSSEQGLEQEYNSLHAQREACEAYIRSQQHEGWRLVPTAYDDGGISGGTMDRPALQRLLMDIRAGRIDTVVVYKVDRLTRSLADFAKMVETFDAHGVSFVAVTQQFNTTTSMGRLTLNILLSFAQFEREVTGERIRDKIAASKQKGMWMGGRVPLGYAVLDRKLVVDAEDAATVVHLYRRYLGLGCVRRLKAELDGQGILSKPRTYANGSREGGGSYSRGALYTLLRNPIYLGEISHKGKRHPGQHEAIVQADLFAAVQAKLAMSNGRGRGGEQGALEPNPLAGKLFDEAGERLVPSFACKGARRYRYYVSASLLRSGERGAAAPAYQGWRLPAREIEQAVETAMLVLLGDRSALAAALRASGTVPEHVPALLDRFGKWSARYIGTASAVEPHPGRAFALLERVELSHRGMLLTLALPEPASGHPENSDPNPAIQHFVPHRIRRRGVEMRLVLQSPTPPSRDDPALLKLVARAHCWFEELASGRAASAQAIAQRVGVHPRYVQRLLPLAMLAPSLVERIVAGQHGPGLTAERLQRIDALPLRWDEQTELLDLSL